jgi:hypothetical protein
MLLSIADGLGNTARRRVLLSAYAPWARRLAEAIPNLPVTNPARSASDHRHVRDHQEQAP